MPKENFVPKAPKEVEKLFDAKVEVTEKDAKKLNPLTKFWEDKIAKAFKTGFKEGNGISRNTKAQWLLIGGLLACSVIGLLSFFGV